MTGWTTEPVCNCSSSNNHIFAPPTKHNMPSSAFLFMTALLPSLILTADNKFSVWLALLLIIIGLFIILSILFLIEKRKRLFLGLGKAHSIVVMNGQHYEDLLQHERGLKILFKTQLQIQEDERKRIARKIHDGLGQLLTAVKFNLEILEDMITGAKEDRERIADMKGLLDSVMKEAREISYDLMPSVLDDFGLAPALQLLCEKFSNRTNIKVQFQAHGPAKRLDPHLEICMYRIAEESLENAAKHTEITDINLQVICSGDYLSLVVEDNGKGLKILPKITQEKENSDMSVIYMRERASSFGGTLAIDSNQNNGTHITVEIPLNIEKTHE